MVSSNYCTDYGMHKCMCRLQTLMHVNHVCSALSFWFCLFCFAIYKKCHAAAGVSSNRLEEPCMSFAYCRQCALFMIIALADSPIVNYSHRILTSGQKRSRALSHAPSNDFTKSQFEIPLLNNEINHSFLHFTKSFQLIFLFVSPSSRGFSLSLK